MAGDEPSEGADPGADADEADDVGDGDSAPRGDGPAEDAPDEEVEDGLDDGREDASGDGPADEPAGDGPATLDLDDVGEEDEERREEDPAAVAEGDDEAGVDGETGDGKDADGEQPEDDGDDREAGETASLERDDVETPSTDSGDGQDDDRAGDARDAEEAEGSAPSEDVDGVEDAYDERPPMAPEGEADPAVDPPVPSDLEPGAAEDIATADVGNPDDLDEESIDHAGPVGEDAEEADGVGGGVLGGDRPGPAEDREMPLAEHIREMLKRLAVVVAVAGLVSILVFPLSERIINFLWYSILPGVESEIARPRLYGVLELLFTELKVASLAGLIVALPVLVYETYAFMRPGLYPHERRYYLAAVPTSLVLAVVGVSFAYFVVLPAIFSYFLYYSQDVATIGFALGRTFDLILLMMGYLAVVFQIPLFLMLAMMMGLVTRQWLADRRLLFWGAFLGISFFFAFDPTGMAPIIVAATMIALFEGTLLLTKWTGRE